MTMKKYIKPTINMNDAKEIIVTIPENMDVKVKIKTK